jgi:AcrR family transcriptional regulator
MDARVRRTRDALGDALIGLMQERSFDTITVQHVLDRAGVGRSTFYVHYSDKNDLLMSDAEEFFEMISTALSVHGDQSDRVAPVREFFTHVGEMRQFSAALVASGKGHETLELAQGHFARGIERRLAELPRGQGIPAEQRPAIAFAQSGALLSLLTWWLDHGMRESPALMDDLYHCMVWMGINFYRSRDTLLPPGCVKSLSLSTRNEAYERIL